MACIFVSDLSHDLAKMMFFERLGEEDRLACAQVNKKSSAIIYGEILKQYKITPLEGVSSHSQLMAYYRRHCHYFQRKLPEPVVFVHPTTVLAAKQIIDMRLSQLGDSTRSRLNEIWDNYVVQSDQYKRELDASPSDTFCLPNPDEEMQLLVRAGVSVNHPWWGIYPDPNILGHTMEQEWCTLETVHLLIDKNITITAATILTAVKIERFEHLVPVFFGLADANRVGVRYLLQELPVAFHHHFEGHIEKMTKADQYEVRIALEQRVSEKIITLLLEKCSEDASAYHIRLALERDFSEDLVLRLLAAYRKCPEDQIGEYHLRLAIDHVYSKKVIEQIVVRMAPNTVDARKISDALDNNYPEDVIAFLLAHVSNDELLEALQHIIEKRRYHELVEKALPKASGVFDARYLNEIASNGYSEAVFLKLLGMTDRESMLKMIYLSSILDACSAKVVEAVVDYGVEVRPWDIQKAKEKHYPAHLIEKMKQKCPYPLKSERSCCIIF